MNPFDLNALGPLMQNMQQRIEEMKKKAAETQVEGTAAGGLVKVVATADNQVVSVQISEDAFEDRELLEDLVRAATNEAMRKAKEEMAQQMQKLTGGLPIPPGLIPGM